MKPILESSIYLIIMAMICMLSIDFVSMNLGISQVVQTEQFIEDYIEIYGTNDEENSIDKTTVSEMKNYAKSRGFEFSYKYETETADYRYYKIQVKYGVRSRMFNLGKNHTYDGIARIAGVS